MKTGPRDMVSVWCSVARPVPSDVMTPDKQWPGSGSMVQHGETRYQCVFNLPNNTLNEMEFNKCE